jgi:hypothetical protein
MIPTTMKQLALILLLATIAHAQSFIDDSMTKPETKAAFKTFKPGPKVQAALNDLEQQGRELLARFRDGQVNEWTLTREKSRRDLAAFTIKAWAFTHHNDEVATVAVIVLGSSEFFQIFPRGSNHLPKQLQPGSVYEAVPGAHILWQFVGQREAAGAKFAIFRRAD